MMKKRILLTRNIVIQWIFLGVLVSGLWVSGIKSVNAQAAKVACVGFYNFENLFDTEDDPTINDEEFLPTGANGWTPELYQEKLGHLADVISKLGKELTPDGIALLGTAEIENRRVLEDLAKQPLLAPYHFNIVQYDSPDERGIDVALLYNPKYFTVLDSRPIRLNIKDLTGDPVLTRDILYVKGLLDGDTLHVMVNHWPSRRGGEAGSRPFRNAAAMECKKLSDSLMAINPASKILIMGDLNDDPTNESCSQIIGAKRTKQEVKPKGFFNPMWEFFRQGIGTLAYQDAWSLFDQVMISHALISPKSTGYTFYRARVFNERFLVQSSGHFKGYPFRTFAGNTYLGGYSDHFPVYLFLASKLPKP